MAKANEHFNVETGGLAETVNMESPNANFMKELLDRQRREIEDELHNIQHGDRPVTGQPHRENINTFFAKRLAEPAGSSGKENVPANVDNVEDHRPESVVVEVQGLFEQHRVSSILQSAAFRRQLESAIRGSISSISRGSSPAQPSLRRIIQNAVSPSISPFARADVSDSNVASTTQVPTVTIHTLESVSSLNQVDVTDSRSTSSSADSSEETDANIGVWRATDDRANLPVTWDMVNDRQREELVEEISELLHNRLVSSTLEGQFRGMLELHMERRLETSTNGEDVANFVRSLPQSQPHFHNDFSHLGLQGPLDNLDNISVTSLSATAVPYSQSNLHLHREIQSLKVQMKEMKNMVKLNFDLSLDIQRAIRQEVAAGISKGSDVAETPAVPGNSRCVPVDSSHCVICLDNNADSVLYQCGHMCVCYSCGKHLLSMKAKCPMCRAPIKDIIRAYRCANQ